MNLRFHDLVNTFHSAYSLLLKIMLLVWQSSLYFPLFETECKILQDPLIVARSFTNVIFFNHILTID